jgi:hypothetical protein
MQCLGQTQKVKLMLLQLAKKAGDDDSIEYASQLAASFESFRAGEESGKAG